MKHQEGRIDGAGGVDIYWQSWLPSSKVKAVVVIVHGLGEHGGRYAHVASELHEIKCAVYALDHRGHGHSTGTRAYIDRFANVTEDIDRLIDLARKAHSGLPVFLLGHSMGGALSLSYALRNPSKLRGVCLSGPAVALEGAPPLMKPIAKMMSSIAPKVGMFKVEPELVSRDPDVVKDYAEDPLNMHAKVPARTLGEIVKFVEYLPAVVSTLSLPLLIQHGREDKLAGSAGSELIYERASSDDKTLKIYDDLYHEIFNELPKDRARVLADLKAWISGRI